MGRRGDGGRGPTRIHLEVLLGPHHAIEALRAGRPVARLAVSDGLDPTQREVLERLASERGVPVERRGRDELDRLAGSPDARHQGVVALAPPRPSLSDVRALLDIARRRKQPPLLVAADGITDPQNLGSLIRSAEAAGAHGLVVTDRRSAGPGPSVGRASAGAIEHLAVAEVVNLPRALDELARAGVWIVGLDMDGDLRPWEVDLKLPTCLVVGAEGRGLGRLVRERCEVVVGIPLLGRVASLNAAVAGAVVLFEAVRQRVTAGLSRSPEPLE